MDERLSSSILRFPRLTALARLKIAVALMGATACSGSPSGPSQPPPAVPDPPQISCPVLSPHVSTTGAPLAVTFAPTVTAGSAPVTLACTPATGTTFPVGSTAVTCTATDARQRTSSCTFNVVVQPPPRLGLTRFVAFGDSITLGEDGNDQTLTRFDLDTMLGLAYPTIILRGREYPFVLENLLRARYTTQQVFVVNAGDGGEYAGRASTLTRFSGIVASRSFDVVLLMEGANDIFGGTGGNPLGIAPAISNLRRMIGDARSRGIRVLLATLPPMNPAGNRGAARYQALPAFNAEVRTLANAEGVPLVDVFDAFNGDFSLLSRDGLHPNAEGFARIAATFFDVIRARFETPQTVGQVGVTHPSSSTTAR